MSDFLAGLSIAGMILLCVFIPVAANYNEKKDYAEHAIYIGDSIALNGDTVEVLEWRTGRYDKNRGYVLSNGMTVDELIVFNNYITGNE